MGLTNVQKHLLSYFNLIKIAPLKSTLAVYKEVLEAASSNKTPNITNLLDEVSAINNEIRHYELEVVKTVDENTPQELFIIVNIADNLMTQKFKFYDESTIQMFSEILRYCVLSQEGCISETDCLNLSTKINVSKTVVKNIIDKLIENKWLVLQNGIISLSMRTIVELEQGIKQQYPDDISNCSFCKLMVIQGYTCNNCDVKCHYACQKKYCARAKNNYKCPNCNESWDDVDVQSECSEMCYDLDAPSTSTMELSAKRRKKGCD